MSAASAATLGPRMNVSAFIMMHGGVDPIPLHNPPGEEYNLTGVELPRNTQLFAPAILGNAYYDTIETDKFIHEIHKRYVSQQRPADYITYCLDQIREFEEEDVAMYGIKGSVSVAMPDQNEKLRRDRLLMEEIIAHKSCVKWKKHTHFIAEKTYSIHVKDTPPNSIMFFCQEGGIPYQ